MTLTDTLDLEDELLYIENCGPSLLGLAKDKLFNIGENFMTSSETSLLQAEGSFKEASGFACITSENIHVASRANGLLAFQKDRTFRHLSIGRYLGVCFEQNVSSYTLFAVKENKQGEALILEVYENGKNLHNIPLPISVTNEGCVLSCVAIGQHVYLCVNEKKLLYRVNTKTNEVNTLPLSKVEKPFLCGADTTSRLLLIDQGNNILLMFYIREKKWTKFPLPTPEPSIAIKDATTKGSKIYITGEDSSGSHKIWTFELRQA